MSTRTEILDTAKELISKEREKEYGSPYKNLNCASELINIYLKYNGLKPLDVCVVMTLVKLARIITGKHKDDNYIDACGYLALGAELEGMEGKE